VDFLLIADQIRDPGNLGTLLRTGLAGGVDGVLLSPGTVDAFSPKVLRAGMGAHFRLPILNCSWEEIKETTQDLTLYAADVSGGATLWEVDLTKPAGLIIGSEAHGPGENAFELADIKIHIPMKQDAESLNASIAGAILIYEVFRQRFQGNQNFLAAKNGKSLP
jgi:TrmH family RNA methyltransferase